MEDIVALIDARAAKSGKRDAVATVDESSPPAIKPNRRITSSHGSLQSAVAGSTRRHSLPRPTVAAGFAVLRHRRDGKCITNGSDPNQPAPAACCASPINGRVRAFTSAIGSAIGVGWRPQRLSSGHMCVKDGRMSKSIADELLASMQEALAIAKGEADPAAVYFPKPRVFTTPMLERAWRSRSTPTKLGLTRQQVGEELARRRS
jgi:hypothetical protein